MNTLGSELVFFFYSLEFELLYKISDNIDVATIGQIQALSAYGFYALIGVCVVVM